MVKQLELVFQAPATEECYFRLEIVPVPNAIALAPDRFHIVSRRHVGERIDAEFQIPGQWTREEASALHREIMGLSWWLTKETNRPCHEADIYGLCEAFCNRVAYQYWA